ncbi:hypothetical protein ACQBAR_01780 [Propionibacteriaceae bacterium Y1685]|uniref:hypothetical protein n=1 Tax=Microlunatus sp. Y1700 TaxID=3418487 RepID=UPI003B7834A4
MNSRPGLELGWARVDITPERPTDLAGFAARAAIGPAAEILSRLFVRVVALHLGERTVVLAVADMLWWGDDTVERVRDACRAAYGLDHDQLVLLGTHTHSAPQPSTRFTPGLGEPDPVWIDELVERTAEAIGVALSGRRRVTAHRRTTPYDLGVDRRHARTGGAVPAAPLDQLLTVINFRAGDDVVATLFQHACHPVVHHGNAVSADFPGAAMTAVESDGAEVALYLQGCCGNINPDRYTADGTFHDGGLPAIEELGRALAEAVAAASTDDHPIQPRLELTRTRVDLPTEPCPDEAVLAAMAAEDDTMRADWAQLMLRQPDRRRGAGVTLTRLELAEDLILLGLSAEVTSPYATALREETGGRVLVLGYCHGMTGYVVTAGQLAEGGYECDEAPYWFGMPGRWAPEVEPTLLSACRAAVSGQRVRHSSGSTIDSLTFSN